MNKITIIQADAITDLDAIEADALFDVRRHYGLFTRTSEYDLVEKISDYVLKLSFELDDDVTVIVVQLPAHQKIAHLLGEVLSMNDRYVVLDGA